jgi:hypothetical protein
MNPFFNQIIDRTRLFLVDHWIEISATDQFFEIKNINNEVRNTYQYNEELSNICFGLSNASVAIDYLIYDKFDELKEFTQRIFYFTSNERVEINAYLRKTYEDKNRIFIEVFPLHAYHSLSIDEKIIVGNLVKTLKEYITHTPEKRLLSLIGELTFLENPLD